MAIPLISIVIPVFECHGDGAIYLRDLLDSLSVQTFKGFQIIISDQSAGNELEELCKTYKLNIKYIKNLEGRGSCEANLNNAISHAEGTWIKVCLQDDYFLVPYALERVISNIKPETKWIFNGCMHIQEKNKTNVFQAHVPQWVPGTALLRGYNLLGSPSLLMYKSDIKHKYFNPVLRYYMDTYFYYNLGLEVGPPVCIPEHLQIIRFREKSISSSQTTEKSKNEEHLYLDFKLANKPIPWDQLPLISKHLEDCGLSKT